MCNFSVGILEKGIAEGIDKGMEKGRLKTLWDLYRESDLTLSRAAEKAGMTEEEFLSAGAALNKETSESAE